MGEHRLKLTESNQPTNPSVTLCFRRRLGVTFPQVIPTIQKFTASHQHNSVDTLASTSLKAYQSAGPLIEWSDKEMRDQNGDSHGGMVETILSVTPPLINAGRFQNYM